MKAAAARCVNSIFERHGIDGQMDPDGAAKPVKFLPAEEDRSARFETLEIIAPGGVYEIRISDWVGFGDGTILMIGTERRMVQSHKVMDSHRLKVTLNTVEAA